MADDLGAILDEILSIRKSLREIPADAFEQRIELRDRLLGLQAALATVPRESAQDPDLRRRLEQLERRRDALLDLRMDHSWSDGGLGGAGVPAEQTEAINRQIDQAGGLPALDMEIARVRAKLTIDRSD